MKTTLSNKTWLTRSDADAAVTWNLPGVWRAYDALAPANWRASIRRMLCALEVPSQGHMLDVGAGSGLALHEARSWVAGGGRYMAIDPDPKALSRVQARARALGVTERVQVRGLRAQDVSELCTQFDGACAHMSLYVLPQQDERRAALRAICSVLRAGARFSCVLPSERFNRNSFGADVSESEAAARGVPPLRRALRALVLGPLLSVLNGPLDEKFDADVFHRFREDEVRDDLAQSGFDHVAVRFVPGFNVYHAVAHAPI